MKNKITVIIPTFKRLEYLSEAIDSVLNQSYPKFKCIIVNDYPDDAPAIQLLLTQKGDKRLLLINHDFPRGGGAARNTGIRYADSEIIAFLDDDDLWLPNKLFEHIQKHQLNPDVGLIYSGLIKRWDNKILPDTVTFAKVPPQNVPLAMLWGKFCPQTSRVTVLKKCFDDCGLFDEKLSSFQDWDMWYRIAQRYSLDYISNPLTIFREHFGPRTSKSIERRFKGLDQIIEKWGVQLGNGNPEIFRQRFIKLGYKDLTQDLILQNQKGMAITYFYKLLRISNQPRDIITLLKLFIIFFVGASRR